MCKSGMQLPVINLRSTDEAVAKTGRSANMKLMDLSGQSLSRNFSKKKNKKRRAQGRASKLWKVESFHSFKIDMI